MPGLGGGQTAKVLLMLVLVQCMEHIQQQWFLGCSLQA
jgi:hypothetical protein